MAGTVYTFQSVGNSRQNVGAILTSQGTVDVGSSGLFLPFEYQSAIGDGLVLRAGPALSPSEQLTAPTVAVGSTGVANGVYRCAVTFVTAAGETMIGPEVSITVVNKQILWSNIPTGTSLSGVLERRLYRTVAGGATGMERLVTTLADNTTTTYTDNVADGSLVTAAPAADNSGVIGPVTSFLPSKTLYATLTGFPSDDAYAIGAGTGAKITAGATGAPGATGPEGPTGATGAAGQSFLSVSTITSSPTPSVDIGTFNELHITALASNITSLTFTGTPVDGQPFILRIKDNGTSRLLSFGSSVVADSGITVPATTVSPKTLLLGFKYDAVSAKWVLLVVNGGY